MTFESIDAQVKKAEKEGYFSRSFKKGCRAISHDNKIFTWPFLPNEWDTYCTKLWDLLHKVANKDIDPTWDMLKFRHEDDYFAGSYSSQLPFWLLAINAINSEKFKYQAYERVHAGVDLFETIAQIPTAKPVKCNHAIKLSTKPIAHLEFRKRLKLLGSKSSIKLCGNTLYRKCRVPRISDGKITKTAIFKNGLCTLEHTDFILSQIQKWCGTGALECLGKINGPKDLEMQNNQNFLSAGIFVVNNGKPRLIWNGHCIKVVEKFKKSCQLDDVPRVLKCLEKDDIVNKYDDCSGFHQLKINKFSRGLTCFRFGNLRFRFTVCPFGIPCIPHHFQGANSVGVNYVRFLGYKAFLYLDDRLTISEMPKKGKAPRAAWLMCAVMICLGGFISRKKSTFEPAKEIEFLGFEINTEHETIRVPDNKWEKFTNLADELLESKWINPKLLEKFRGKCCSFLLACPMMRLFIRNQSRWIAEANKGTGLKMGKKLLSSEVKSEILRWKTKKGITTRRSWHQKTYDRVKLIHSYRSSKSDLVIATDASTHGGGIVFNESEWSFYWKRDQAHWPIHLKEAQVILEALEINKKCFYGKNILFECDNKACCLAFNFGSRDPIFNKIITSCHDLAIDFNFNIEIIWVPTTHQRADEPSRVLHLSENEIAQSALERLEKVLGWKFSLDAMATRFNRKAPFFISREFDCEALTTNFFTYRNFKNHKTYVFPPMPIFSHVICHLLKFGKEATWAVVCRFSHQLPDLYPQLLHNQNIHFFKADCPKGLVLTPAKKNGQYGFFKEDQRPFTTVFVVHLPYPNNFKKHSLF